jgi:hypothetical protein
VCQRLGRAAVGHFDDQKHAVATAGRAGAHLLLPPVEVVGGHRSGHHHTLRPRARAVNREIPSLDDMSVHRAPVNGIDIAYETFGSPHDPTMLLIMGLGTQMIAWPMISALTSPDVATTSSGSTTAMWACPPT